MSNKLVRKIPSVYVTRIGKAIQFLMTVIIGTRVLKNTKTTTKKPYLRTLILITQFVFRYGLTRSITV